MSVLQEEVRRRGGWRGRKAALYVLHNQAAERTDEDLWVERIDAALVSVAIFEVIGE